MSASVAELRGPVLRSVSRSFYLSIRLLPGGLRDPIALGYLLARATDTIADTGSVDAAFRSRQLNILSAAVAGDDAADAAAAVRDSFAPLQRNQQERRLIEALPSCIAWLEALAPADRDDIRQVLAKITEGQRSDLQHFGSSGELTALRSAADLDRYTYLVAGCVGEFWTSVCFRHLPHFATLPRDQMLSLGVSYGKGLQLINVLRDVGADLRAGRCYLPLDELTTCGITPTDVLQQPTRIEPLLRKWRAIAFDGIAAGVKYACAIRSRRVRFATILPALIGARTLALLRDAGVDSITHPVKVPRSEVRRLLVASAASAASTATLHRLFARSSGDGRP